MNRREFMKMAAATVAGVSVGGIGGSVAAGPVRDWIQLRYTPPRFKAGGPIRAGAMVYIAAMVGHTRRGLSED